MERPLLQFRAHHERQGMHLEDSLQIEELNLLELPVELLLKILKLLSQQEKINFARTCKYSKNLAYQQELWMKTHICMHLSDDLTDCEKIYTSFHTRNLSTLHFSAPNYTVLLKHLYLMKDFWPDVTLICDSNKNRTNLAFEELNQVQPLSLTNVKTFVMGNFNSSIFNAFKKVLDSVSYLCVSNTSLDDNIANELVQCKNLRALNVSKTLISDFGILTLCGFRQTKSGETSYEIKASLFDIEIFDISNNLNVSKNCWQFLKGLPKLRILVTSYVDEYCPDVESFQKLLDLESLTCLCLDSSNSPVAVISALNTSDSNLKSLSYKFCELRDFDLLRLNSSIGFQNLSFLKMSSVFITDNGIDSVCKYLKNLIILDIGGCKNLTDVSLANIFQSLEKLKVLCVNGCNRMTATQLSKMREQSKDCVIKSDFPLSNPVLGKITEETLREVLFSYHFVTNGFSEIQNFSVI